MFSFPSTVLQRLVGKRVNQSTTTTTTTTRLSRPARRHVIIFIILGVSCVLITLLNFSIAHHHPTTTTTTHSSTATTTPPTKPSITINALPQPGSIITTNTGHLHLTSTSFLPTMRAFGVSVRPKQLISDADWFIPNPPQQPYTATERLTIHAVHVSAALHAMPRERICPPGQGGWLWIEDDVYLCPDTKAHLTAMECTLKSLPVMSQTVFIRTSFGFNGLVVRCSRTDEFMAIVDQIVKQKKVGIDYSMSFAFRHQEQQAMTAKPGVERPVFVAVYAYQLFQHAGLKSEIWENFQSDGEVGRREAALPKCGHINVNTHNPLEVFNAYCLHSRGDLFSPCPDDISWKNHTDQCEFPKVADLRHVQSPNFTLTSTHGMNETCDQVCSRFSMKCSVEGIADVNLAMVSGNVVTYSDGAPPCMKPRTMTEVSVFHKHCLRPYRAVHNYCFARAPVMDEPNPCGKLRTALERRCNGNFICACV